MGHLTLAIPNPLHKDQLEQLRQAAGAGPVLITTHTNPDPDALASGLALATLLMRKWHISSRLVFSGRVGRAENCAVHRLLTPQWEYAKSLPHLHHYSAVALVDSQPGAGNNDLPSNYVPKIVIDHHIPVRKESEQVPYADIRSDIGATVTMLYQYLSAARIPLEPELATAMFYGLRSDTNGLARGATMVDSTVYALLHAVMDTRLLTQVERSGLSRQYFSAFDQGLQHASIFGQTILSFLGNMHRPDLAAEMADILICLEDIHVALCLGCYENTLYFSLRTDGIAEDAGQLVQRILPHGGTAGGHGSIAGGQIPLSGQDIEQIIHTIRTNFLFAVGETERKGCPLILEPVQMDTFHPRGMIARTRVP